MKKLISVIIFLTIFTNNLNACIYFLEVIKGFGDPTSYIKTILVNAKAIIDTKVNRAIKKNIKDIEKEIKLLSMLLLTNDSVVFELNKLVRFAR